jgi:transcriptional regulator with XRE-family HTH domain
MSINFRSLQDRLRERLLAYINAGELTGMELARQTGFQQAHISNFLNRKRGLSLDAMDAILKTTQISLLELIPTPAAKSSRARKPGSECDDYVSIAVIQEPESTATNVPNSGVREVLKVAAPEVQRLQPSMHTPRPHWDRFVALRVKASDALAMSPRLTRGALVIVDRHYNSLVPWRNQRNVYLVSSEGMHIRYVEQVGEELILRAHNPEEELRRVARNPGQDAMSAIIGRVCLMQVQW